MVCRRRARTWQRPASATYLRPSFAWGAIWICTYLHRPGPSRLPSRCPCDPEHPPCRREGAASPTSPLPAAGTCLPRGFLLSSMPRHRRAARGPAHALLGQAPFPLSSTRAARGCCSRAATMRMPVFCDFTLLRACRNLRTLCPHTMAHSDRAPPAPFHALLGAHAGSSGARTCWSWPARALGAHFPDKPRTDFTRKLNMCISGLSKNITPPKAVSSIVGSTVPRFKWHFVLLGESHSIRLSWITCHITVLCMCVCV